MKIKDEAETRADTPPEYDGDGGAESILEWALEKFRPRIAIACSFQQTVLIDMAVKIDPKVRVFSIDTGRLPEETFQCAQDIEQRFGIGIEWYFPLQTSVEKMLSEKGPYSFKESLEARKECCWIRKVEPLERALNELDAWVTGVRREQSASRSGVEKIEIDQEHGGIVKVNPLADWTGSDIENYVREHKLPYNRLFEQGYSSIGCKCCTRPIEPGEDPRAGRWWWESSDHKECGLHVRDWQI